MQADQRPWWQLLQLPFVRISGLRVQAVRVRLLLPALECYSPRLGSLLLLPLPPTVERSAQPLGIKTPRAVLSKDGAAVTSLQRWCCDRALPVQRCMRVLPSQGYALFLGIVRSLPRLSARRSLSAGALL